MAQKLKFRGVPVYMNGQNYYIPSLSTRQYQEQQAFLNAGVPDDTPPEKVVTWFFPLILMAIQRNYPDVTNDDLLDWLDAGTATEAVKAVTGQSKLEGVTEGE